MDPLLLDSATRLAARIRAREVTSREVVEAHIARIQEVNPRINAVVAHRFEQARAEASRADEQVERVPPEDLPPLHGVPCTIKESFALEGMPNTSGHVSRRELRATSDAVTVARLRAAGAVPLGVTNVPELCMWFETHNRIYGRTNNPYDPRRIAGGSSGGEGAIVGAGGSPFGLGADIGGSIRMPAFFNGVFGHKPTGGLVPNTGQYPVAENEALRYLATGPLARRAEDLFPLLRILAGPDGVDTGCDGALCGDPAEVDLSTLTVVSVEDGATEDLLDAQARAAEALARRGAKVRHAGKGLFAHAFEIWSAALSAAAGTPFGVLLGGGEPVQTGRELLKWAVRRSSHTLPALAFAGVESLVTLTRGRNARLVALGRELREEVVELIGPRGVMLYPPHPRPAPFHYRPLLWPFDARYTAIFNVLELPVTQVPLGLNAQGVPLGVQVAAVHGHDHLTVAVALELERACGGWVPPPSRSPARRR